MQILKKLSPGLTKLEIKKVNDTNEWAPLKVVIMLLSFIKVAGEQTWHMYLFKYREGLANC